MVMTATPTMGTAQKLRSCNKTLLLPVRPAPASPLQPLGPQIPVSVKPP